MKVKTNKYLTKVDSQLTLITQALRSQYCSIITYSKFYLRKATRGSLLYVPLAQKYIYELVAWTQQAKLFKRQSVEVLTRCLSIVSHITQPLRSHNYLSITYSKDKIIQLVALTQQAKLFKLLWLCYSKMPLPINHSK